MMTAPIRDVSETAVMVAMWRAGENDRRHPLYRDPLALKLAGTRGKEIVAGLSRSRAIMATWMMAVRTRIIDDLIREALTDGIDTVVNLGAGLDARPYRLDLHPSLRWIEVDSPELLELKSRRLADETPVCQVSRIACDLADPDARRTVLGEISKDSRIALVLAEGVIPYLTNEQVGGLADDLKAHPCFRYWIADYVSPFARSYRERQAKRMSVLNAPFRFDPKDYFGFFASHGWRLNKIRWMLDAAENLGRGPPALMRLFWTLRGIFMSAERRQEMRRFMAYVLFEPA